MYPTLPPELPDTRLEAIEGLRQLIASGGRTPTAREHLAAKEPAGDDTAIFRPLHRPPAPLLCVFDDGQDDGEWVRLRGDRLTFGRTEGDILIPHDGMMSSRHAELVREVKRGAHRWYLVDLQSTNGSFVRIATAVINHGQEFVVGTRRLRLNATAPPAGPDPNDTQATRGWQKAGATEVYSTLVELTPQGEGKRHVLAEPENWLGRDAQQCNVCVAEDAMVSPKHARLYRDARMRWVLENNGSRNGVWVRVSRVPLDGSAMFQLGEQRFLLKVTP